MLNLFKRYQRLLEHAIAILVLLLLLNFSYLAIFKIPYAGFEMGNGTITMLFSNQEESESLQVGDRLIQVGPVDMETFRSDLHLELFEGVSAGQVVTIIVERDGQQRSVNWTMPGATTREIFERLNSQWWLAYIFWVAGTAALLFIRPKDTRWSQFVAFSYLTAIWLAAGSGPSLWHLGHGAISMRAAIWLCVPVYLHFHWNFPRPLARLPVAVWWLLYLAAGVLALLEWLQIPDSELFVFGGLLAFGGSIVLLIVHFFLRRMKRDDILLLAGVLLSFLLVIVLGLTQLGGVTTRFTHGGALLSLAAIPGAYFFVLFWQQYVPLIPRSNRMARIYVLAVLAATLFVSLLTFTDPWFDPEPSSVVLGLVSIIMVGSIWMLALFPFVSLSALAENSDWRVQRPGQLRLRANRLVSIYLFFFITLMGAALLLVVLENLLTFPGETTVLAILTSLAIGLLTVVGFERFQRFIDQRLLGIQLAPKELLENYAARITTSLERSTLIHLLQDEILPSLLIRQSALYEVTENVGLELLYASGVEIDPALAKEGLAEIMASHSQASKRSKWTPEFDWVKLALPLQVEKRLTGIWLLGQRDPDDLYAQSEIRVLKAIANQTAIALVNIKQADQLHALFQADIQRQDAERHRLARGLHDVVLNQLASLSIQAGEQATGTDIQEEIQAITTYVREVVSDLRPAMLSYGLYLALVELCEQLNDRSPASLEVHCLIPPAEVRYEPHVEENLFWIVHQACENALQHSGGRCVKIDGVITAERVYLVVEDDGVGFTPPNGLDIAALLKAQHFGLVGMFERARLIGAGLQIDSVPTGGTRLTVALNGDLSRQLQAT
jgi:signal transduction histidine kinase